jgi:hypothetical protein
MRKVVNDVLVRYEDEQLRFPIRVLGELREAAKQVIASTRDEERRPRKTDKPAAQRGRSHRELAVQAVMPMTSGSACRRRRK